MKHSAHDGKPTFSANPLVKTIKTTGKEKAIETTTKSQLRASLNGKCLPALSISDIAL
ncbi:hypothetical protein [Undibacterium sp. Di24W]|uniref:hypothetical protein n=1 Tax=Undibacterium sp. Di24W TaxID=3413033 RepID=UPI003BF2EA94